MTEKECDTYIPDTMESWLQTWCNVVPMIDSLRFLGPVCYCMCAILTCLVWMESRDHEKLCNTGFICVALLL